MEKFIAVVSSDNFAYGFTAGAIVFVFLMIYAAFMRARYLYDCAQNESAVKVGKKFYYLVDESVYVHLDMPSAYAKRMVAQLDGTNA
jgi:hypothetical protein